VLSFESIEDGFGRYRRAWIVAAFLDGFAKLHDPNLAQLLLFLKEAQALADDFAGAGIATPFELMFDEMLEMFADNVAGWHGHSPRMFIQSYQFLIAKTRII
jgi:hypothetical protein